MENGLRLPVGELVEFFTALGDSGRCPAVLTPTRVHDLLLGKLGPNRAPSEELVPAVCDLLSNPLIGVFTPDGQGAWWLRDRSVSAPDLQASGVRMGTPPERENRPREVSREVHRRDRDADRERAAYQEVERCLQQIGHVERRRGVTAGSGNRWRTVYEVRSAGGARKFFLLRWSKTHQVGGQPLHWYGIDSGQFEELTRNGRTYLVFIAQGEGEPYVIPASELASHLREAGMDYRGQWKLSIHRGSDGAPELFVHSPGPGGGRMEVGRYRGAWPAD